MDEAAPGDTKPCLYCGETILAVAVKCRHCGEFLDADLRRQAGGSDALQRMLLPVDRSGWAVAAGYMGLLSPFPCFGITSLPAIIVSLVALKDLRKNPELHGKGRAYFGLTLGILTMLLWLGVAGFRLAHYLQTGS